MMNDKNVVGGIVALLLVVGGVLFIVSDGNKASVEQAPEGATQLAQCLADSGAVFYGAFWCPHCKKQKELFGSAEKILPYVECSTPNGKEQTQVCKDKGITGYPTWIFKDASQLSGEATFAQLAEKSGCANPLGGASSTPTITASTSAPQASPALTPQTI